MEKKLKEVQDLGVGAYLLMHAYKVVGKKGRSVIFEINVNEEKDFDEKKMDYLSSEFHRFDSCLMSLKKMGDDFQSYKN